MILAMAPKPRWTPQLDEVLLRTIYEDGRYTDAARAVAHETRGRFTPHASTCYRRVLKLDEARAIEHASTRVDAIAPRRRAPVAERLPPPGVNVLALDSRACEKHRDGAAGVVRELLCAVPPGWVWTIADFDETRSDAIACARHQARLRGDEFDVVEETPAQPALVLVRTPGAPSRLLVLIVVRFARA